MEFSGKAIHWFAIVIIVTVEFFAYKELYGGAIISLNDASAVVANDQAARKGHVNHLKSRVMNLPMIFLRRGCSGGSPAAHFAQ